jgi:cysteine desulfuration protein SufE
MTKTINKIQDEIIKEFSNFKDWFETYEYLIKLGKSLEPTDEELKSEKNTISGCQSQVWLKAELKNDKIHYLADSDSLFTKGMIKLLLRVLDNQIPEEIVETDLYFIDKISLGTNLSPSRVNGLNTIVKQIKSYAEEVIKAESNKE